jgi:GTPase involved in cell partitioning and DNA repair
MTELNTTREKRDETIRRHDIEGGMTLYGRIAQDANALEDELARVREELSKSDSMVITANEQAIMYREEREKLREELESASKILMSCGSPHLGRWDLEVMAIQHMERFGGRDERI